jgi:hypothetical protein
VVRGYPAARLPKTNETAAEAMMFKHFLICAMMASPAFANQFWDGNKLLMRMNGDSYDQAHALGYVMGVFDTDGRRKVCAPQNITSGQLYDIVKQQLETRPEFRHFHADVIVLGSLALVWPCERKKGSSS